MRRALLMREELEFVPCQQIIGWTCVEAMLGNAGESVDDGTEGNERPELGVESSRSQ